MTEWTPEEERVANWFSDHWWDGCEVKSGGGRIAACTGPCACREAARDVLAISAMQPRWRDVKTDPPPRDGTRIVVWIDESSEAMVAFWGKHDWLNEEWWIATDEMNAVNPEYVTRWMPLPPAPEPKP